MILVDTSVGTEAIANKFKKTAQSFYLDTIHKGGHGWSGKPM